MSNFFGTIVYLNRNIDYKSYRADKAVRKFPVSGDPVRLAAEIEGSGGVHFAANLKNLNQYKRGSINAFHNALPMLQIQSEGLRQAEKIYNRMLSVAQMELVYLGHNETGFPTISVGTASDAHKNIDVLRAEIDNPGEQNGRIASNLNRVEIAMYATQNNLRLRKKHSPRPVEKISPPIRSYLAKQELKGSKMLD